MARNASTNDVTISPAESKLFGSLLWEGLAEVKADQWTDFPWVIQVFCKVAHTYQLEGALLNLEGEANAAVASEIQRRAS